MPNITLQTATPENDFFSYKVYASTRVDEMAVVNWSDAQKEAFLQMQFKAQRGHYLEFYPEAEYQIILKDEIPIGRLITDRSKERLLIMDIALLPEYRNAGVGTSIIRTLMDEVTRTGLPLLLHVEFFNPALKLYSRLGFEKTSELNGVYFEMTWKPNPGNSIK